jgi:penicillin-binding protein 1A
VFANHGQRAQPTPILEIVDAQGKVLVDNISPLPKTTTVLSATVADNVTSILQSVITGGTGTAAALGRPAAGKTGTTTNTTDAWFAGYTPTLSAAVWMGNEQSDAVSVGAVTGHLVDGGEMTFPQVYGGTWPALTWKEFMSAALANVPPTQFNVPAPIITPTEAAALQQEQTTTTVVVEPGTPGSLDTIPAGGPYQYPPPSLAAPEPITVPPSTTTTTSTTLPKSTTTSSPSSTSSTTSTSVLSGGGSG